MLLSQGVSFIFDHSYPSLIFSGKAWRLPLEQSPVNEPTQEGSSLAFKYQSSVEVTDDNKHPSFIYNISTEVENSYKNTDITMCVNSIAYTGKEKMAKNTLAYYIA